MGGNPWPPTADENRATGSHTYLCSSFSVEPLMIYLTILQNCTVRFLALVINIQTFHLDIAYFYWVSVRRPYRQKLKVLER